MDQHAKQEAIEANSDQGADALTHCRTSEASVLRILIKMAVEDVQAAVTSVSTAASKDEPAGTTSSKLGLAAAFTDLGRQLSLFLARLKALGPEKLMGKEQTAALQELQWYVCSAWNAALQAAGRLLTIQ
jgi:hypothetical protein